MCIQLFALQVPVRLLPVAYRATLPAYSSLIPHTPVSVCYNSLALLQPTFIFYKDGKRLEAFSGAQRDLLITLITPPPPCPAAADLHLLQGRQAPGGLLGGAAGPAHYAGQQTQVKESYIRDTNTQRGPLTRPGPINKHCVSSQIWVLIERW